MAITTLIASAGKLQMSNERWVGMDAKTGRRLSGVAHIEQSLGKAFTTPLRSRVMRRLVGSIIPDLIDQPLNGKTRMLVMAASVMVVSRWEPRVTPTSVQLSMDASGTVLCADMVAAVKDGPSAGQTSTTFSVPLKG